MEIAYTIGHTKNYQKAFQSSSTVYKTGRQPDYEGGWIWKTKEEAQKFLIQSEFNSMSVFGIQLPNDWNQDVSEQPGTDGVHHLLIDALLFQID